MTYKIDQERAPIYETLANYARTGIYGFHTPGHKGGRFAAAEITELVGRSGLALDLPGMTATDNTFHPTGCVRDAQELAAELFGAAATFYLSAGSTLGIATALMAAAPQGGTVALPRNIHRSVVAGLVLSGASPRFVPHEVLPECGALGVTPVSLAAALDSEPKPAAVLLTRPSYYGLARDLEDVAAVCHERRVPLIVDEAHGAHLHFLPPGSPQPAIAAGADLAVQSCHKTLGSLVGSAQLHVGRESVIEPGRVQEALNFLQTTSPSFLLLASLDVMRRWMWREGRELFAAAVEEARRLEDEIDSLPGLKVFRPEGDPRLAGHRRDPLRVVVNVSGTGWSGYEVERYLRTEFRVEDEMADWFNVVYILSPRDDAGATQRLLAGLRAISEQHNTGAGTPRLAEDAVSSYLLQPPVPPLAMSPRAAALANKATVALDSAAGRTCAEMVMFYPPGIPLLMPGEMVTRETIEVCRKLLAAGAHPYASDPTLETVRVVE
ncbi:MAG: aminotransferase class I/II-fold pyridoxal phosphate-dependent enzyme [Planctomycetes bacterium]|nr:aminotransferase class I/II-fold pyridoxal phosphate-dependent enzyme [Planctomycetota bacterium]